MEPKMQNILGETSKKNRARSNIKAKFLISVVGHNILLFPQNKEKHAMLLDAAEPAKLSMSPHLWDKKYTLLTRPEQLEASDSRALTTSS